MMPHLQFEWQHDFLDDPSEVEPVPFDPAARLPSLASGRTAFRFGVGMYFLMTKGLGLLHYERLISRGASREQPRTCIRIEF